MTVPTLPIFHRPYSWPEIDDTIRADGGAIVAGFLSPDRLQELNDQFDRFIERHQQVGQPTSSSDGYNTFLGHKTIRLHGLIEKAPASADLIGDPHLIDWATRHIAPERAPDSGAVVLNAAELIQIEPSESRQAAHRDTDSWPEAPDGEFPLAVNAIVALDPFTLENGATYVAPGSWSWDRDRRATSDEYARATMEAGDAVLFRGDLIHRGGENLSDGPRRAISISYSAGWLRPVENSFLNLSAATIASLTPQLQALIGFQAHDATDQGGGLLGLYENGDPAEALPPRS